MPNVIFRVDAETKRALESVVGRTASQLAREAIQRYFAERAGKDPCGASWNAGFRDGVRAAWAELGKVLNTIKPDGAP